MGSPIQQSTKWRLLPDHGGPPKGRSTHLSSQAHLPVKLQPASQLGQATQNNIPPHLHLGTPTWISHYLPPAVQYSLPPFLFPDSRFRPSHPSSQVFQYKTF